MPKINHQEELERIAQWACGFWAQDLFEERYCDVWRGGGGAFINRWSECVQSKAHSKTLLLWSYSFLH